MAVYEIEIDGQVYEVDAPDERAAISAARKFTSQTENPKEVWEVMSTPSPEGTLGAYLEDAGSDVPRSLMSGAGRGIMGLLTLPSSVGGLMDQGFERLTGVDANPQGGLPSAGRMAQEAYEGGVAYQPQTTAGEYAETVGEFLPGMALGGTAPQMIAAGLGSEAAGQATEGTKWEPWARIGGGIVGGGIQSVLANRANNAGAIRDYIATAEPSEALRAKAKALYQKGHARNIKIKPVATQQLNQRVRQIANEAGLITPTGKVVENADVRQIFSLLDDYANAPVTTKQMQALRRRISSLAGSPDRELSRVGVEMKQTYDDFLGQFAPEFKQANEINRRAMLGQMMDQYEDLAEVRASQFSQSGMENALRTEFRQLDRNIAKGKTKGLRPDQVQAVQDVSRGTTASNAARQVGKLAPRGPVSFGQHAFPFLAGNYIGGPAMGAAFAGSTAGTGILGQMMATHLQKLAAQRASAAMRQPNALQLAPRNPVFPGVLPGLAVTGQQR